MPNSLQITTMKPHYQLLRRLLLLQPPRTLQSCRGNVTSTATDANKKSPSSSSVSPAEVAKFRRHADRWWSGPEFAPLRSMNSLRVPLISSAYTQVWTPKAANQPLAGVKLLDIGCGGGILAEALARLGAQVTGIDPVAESIEAARAHASSSFSSSLHSQPSYLNSSIEALAAEPANADAFDGVIASEVLEHVDNIELFLRSALAVLRPSTGRLFLTTINQTPLAYLTVVLAAEAVGLVPKGTHEYSKLVSPEALRLLLEQDFGCAVRLVHGMAFNPLTGGWSWTQLQALNYAMVVQKL